MVKYRVKQYGSIPPPYGGVAVFIKRLMLALNTRGWICGAFYSQSMDCIPESLNEYIDRFPRHSRSLFILPEIPRLLRIFKKYDLIHSHLALSSCFSTWIAHKLLKVPVVYTIHNQMIDLEFSILNGLDRYCLKSLADDSNVQFISVNTNVEDMMNSHGIYFKNPIEVLPAYIPPVEFGNISDHMSKSLANFIVAKDPYILFYAESLAKYRDTEIYGLKDAMAAFKQLKSSFNSLRMLICVANIDNVHELNGYKIDVQEYNDSVYWQIGSLSEMWPLLKTAAILLRPTSTDGDSIMVREALAYGLPVVASDVVSRPVGCYVYEYGNIDDMVHKSADALASPSKKIIPQNDYTDSVVKIYMRLLA